VRAEEFPCTQMMKLPRQPTYVAHWALTPQEERAAFESCVDTIMALWHCGCSTPTFGTAGLQVFHFNGAYPITHYTATLTKTPINSVHWDNANHLYALSYSTGKLYVYTITPSTVTQVPGSPYTISRPTSLLVR
jgi:hypothetical protein